MTKEHGKKLNAYFKKHYGEHQDTTHWVVNPRVNRWMCYISGIQKTILFTFNNKGEICELPIT